MKKKSKKNNYFKNNYLKLHTYGNFSCTPPWPAQKKKPMAAIAAQRYFNGS